MEKLLFCLQCKSPMNKIKPLAEDILTTTQKVLVNQLQSFQNKDKMLLFNQWECKCGSNIITIEQSVVISVCAFCLFNDKY